MLCNVNFAPKCKQAVVDERRCQAMDSCCFFNWRCIYLLKHVVFTL